MAHAAVETCSVTKQITVEEPIVTLVLTLEEARVLRLVVGGLIGGGRVRERADAIFYALRDVGVGVGEFKGAIDAYMQVH